MCVQFPICNSNSLHKALRSLSKILFFLFPIQKKKGFVFKKLTFFVVVFSVAVRRQCCSYFAHCECTVELSTKKNERRINLLLQDAEGKALFENLRVLRRVSFILNKNNNNQRITLGCVFNLISVDIDSRLQRAFL